jgi:hypothetical protein
LVAPAFHFPTVVISAEDKVDRLVTCTALLPPEAAEPGAQQEAAAVAAEPGAQQEAAAVVAAVEPDAQRAAAVAVEPDAQQEAAAVAAEQAPSDLLRPATSGL